MAEEPGPFDYTGLHAFVFVDHVSETDSPIEVVNRLRNELKGPPEGPVMFAGDVVGAYQAFAHLRVEEGDLSGLLDLINGPLREQGVRCKYAVETGVYKDGERVIGTKRGTPEFIGLVSVEVKHGMIDSVLKELGKLPAFRGASIVTGDFDILLQLGGETLDEVLQAGMGALQQIDGIKRTSTALLDGRR
ncbi:MAG TPA: Lrp/AsnC ligand binding domain-containing protein [Actinomycetota bacterium]|nr:Lrp/AsnC ligand binding domain-containing protein [Actinomycetota bacterium]